METKTTSQVSNLQQQASEVIKNYIATSGIYSFATKTATNTTLNAFKEDKKTANTQTHLFLLVITEETKNNATADLADLIAGTIPNCNATLLLHKATSLRQLTANQKWFFNHIMTNGTQIWINKNHPPYLHLDKEPTRKPELSELYWNNRVRIAKTYLESEHQIETSGMECVQHSMQHIAVEQICLGLIEVFLGYHPNHYALAYLFNLCSIFTTLPEDIFPTKTEEDQLLYKLLTTNFHTLRHAKTNYHSFTYTELLSKRCGEFIENAQIAATNELNRIATI